MKRETMNMAGKIRCSNSARRVIGLGAEVLCLWVFVFIQPGIIFAQSIGSREPSSDFSRYSVIQPKVFHARTKREISSTKESDSNHTELLTVGFAVDGVDRILDLRLNRDLIPVGYQQRHQDSQGVFKTHKPSAEEVEICQYQGSVRGIPDSWAAVSTCEGLSGVVFDGKTLHYIHPQADSLNAPHYLYKHDHLAVNNTCGFTGSEHHSVHEEANRMLRYKRNTYELRGPYNANKHSRYIEFVMVIDKKGYMALDRNLNRVHQHCKDIVNIINALYTPLNIFIALVGIEVWTDNNKIAISADGEITLSNFLQYRKQTLVKEVPNDNAQLLTKVQFKGGVVGKALKGLICTYEFSGGVSMDHSEVIGLVAATVAHEMGHNFGMEHDTPECKCPEERCIMAPVSSSIGPTHWSACSLEYLALAFEHGMDYCLRNKPERLFDNAMCGNGFVEQGEQCDCGLEANCNNPCCNALTCMLHTNASCATGECCDLNTCKPKTAGTVCRQAEHECDLPEYCSGQGEYCPSDVFKIDGETCSMGKAFCYKGSCRTRHDQCQLLWGPSGFSSEKQCYDLNVKGTKFGNCGYNLIDKSFTKCNVPDKLCGMLHCKHVNERLEFGMESAAILSHSFLNIGSGIIPCRTAIIDFGLNQVDPGLVPDGASCDTGKMCVNQKCVPVAAMRFSTPAGNAACPNNCSGNGVCNSRGNCHCNNGYQPPRCDEIGVGGSIDSGPAEDPSAMREFIISLYVIFFGIVPLVALIALYIWTKKGGKYRWKKGATSAVDRANNALSIKTIERSSPIPRNIETIDSTLSQDSACASLLPKTERDERFNNNLFGQFKGFTLSPIQNQPKLAEPTKAAPPPPTVLTVPIKTNVKLAQRSNTLRNTLSSGVSHVNQTSIAPALPPLNPGCNARPLISSPVLSTTTCTSVEIIGPKIPCRPAPEVPGKITPDIPGVTIVPQKPQRPNSTPLTNAVLPELDKRPERSGGALNRIASILRPNSGIMRSNSQPAAKDDKKTNSLPRNQHHKANKVIDKEILRNLEISNPIPQSDIEIPTPAIPVTVPDAVDTEEKKAVVMRAQSMRDSNITARPAIHTFGSMRQATNSAKRPTSIPASARPTSPPPGPPRMPSTEKIAETGIKIPGLPGYQNPPVKSAPKIPDNAYDDCMNLVTEPSLGKIMEESPSSDNIYAVIEESVPEKNRKKIEPQVPTTQNEYKSPKPLETSPKSGGSSDSMGLLSEIVSEISNRNFDSIYSTSTLARKKKEKEEMEKNSENLGSNSSLGTYINSSQYKTPGSIYSTSPSGKFNSASSTTSSGYLNPSAVNVPQPEGKKEAEQKAPVPPKDPKVVCKSKLGGLNSNNPNINDEMSKQLGMKPTDSALEFKPFAASSKPLGNLSATLKKDEKKEDSKILPTKPPLNRTKTPPNLAKVFTPKQVSESNLKTAKQGSDLNIKPTRQGSDTSLKTSRQGSDASLKSNKQGGNLNKSNPNLNKSNTNLNRSTNNLNKNGSSSNLSTMSLKNASSSPKNSVGNLSTTNSPDLVSSCSNSSQNIAKSPDVLGNNPKTTGTLKSTQKTPTMTRSAKTPTTPPKPTNILMKSASLVDKKKSPNSSNTTIVKSLSAKESNANKTVQPAKGLLKNEVKVNGETAAKVFSVQKAASSKSNVASLQQRFEASKNMNQTRTMSTIGKKNVPAKTVDVNRSSSAKK